MSDYKEHYSVLNKEVIDYFKNTNCSSNLFCDLTFGAGGHTFAIANSIENSNVISFDQDLDAFKNGLQNIENKNLSKRVNLINSNFSNIKSEIEKRYPSFEGFRGIVADLGVSSHHFDDGQRGFSFRFEANLDMRMSQNLNELTAEKIVNEWSLEELTEIFYDYGEEKFSKRIAERICELRTRQDIKTTKDLEDIIFHCYPKKMRHGNIHPATRVFQALRIAVNDELGVLKSVIPDALDLLAKGGRLCIISFHSLEDRIAKRQFRAADSSNFKILTKRPIIPSEVELSENNRSRSAKLRVIERI